MASGWLRSAGLEKEENLREMLTEVVGRDVYGTASEMNGFGVIMHQTENWSWEHNAWKMRAPSRTARGGKDGGRWEIFHPQCAPAQPPNNLAYFALAAFVNGDVLLWIKWWVSVISRPKAWAGTGVGGNFRNHNLGLKPGNGGTEKREEWIEGKLRTWAHIDPAQERRELC